MGEHTAVPEEQTVCALATQGSLVVQAWPDVQLVQTGGLAVLHTAVPGVVPQSAPGDL